MVLLMPEEEGVLELLIEVTLAKGSRSGDLFSDSFVLLKYKNTKWLKAR